LLVIPIWFKVTSLSSFCFLTINRDTAARLRAPHIGGGKMRKILGICSLIIVSLLFHFGASTPSSAQSSENEAKAATGVPDKVIYEFYFRRIAYFEDLANKPDQTDLSRIKMRMVINAELEINEAQKNVLLQISNQALDAAAHFRTPDMLCNFLRFC
jgi:hypothetical protein